MHCALRPYHAATDLNFVFKAWISSYERSPWAGTIPAHLTYDIHKATIIQLMQRGMRITMAVNPDDHNQILGFLAHEPGLVHYLFVKDLFRRQGVASNLLASANFDRTAPLLTSFRTPDAKYLGKLLHRPGLARRKAAYP
jgi:GNAT superfamily N-acetyltransferase